MPWSCAVVRIAMRRESRWVRRCFRKDWSHMESVRVERGAWKKVRL